MYPKVSSFTKTMYMSLLKHCRVPVACFGNDLLLNVINRANNCIVTQSSIFVCISGGGGGGGV